jgi:hypothetical protein
MKTRNCRPTCCVKDPMSPSPRHLVAAVAVAFAAAMSPPAAQAASVPATCSALSGGTALAQTAAIKVVGIRSRDRRVSGTRIFGCVKPEGRVRLLGVDGIVENSFFTDQATELVSVAGTFITLAKRFDTEANAGPDVRVAVDLRTGRSREYYAGIISNCGADPTAPVAREILGADGRLVAIFQPVADPLKAGCSGYRNAGQTQIRALRPDGQLQLVDLAPVGDIPVDSLALDGERVTWTRAGVTRTARVGSGVLARRAADPKRPCSALKGRRNLSPDPRLRVVRLGHSFVGCEPGSDDAAVYTLGAAAGTIGLTIDAVDRPLVAYTFTHGSHVTKGFRSLQTGGGSTYWDADLSRNCTTDPRAATPPPVAIAMSVRSGLIAEFEAKDAAEAACYPNAGAALVLGFPGTVEPVTFDLAPAGSIPASSLRLAGRTASWTRGGIPQRGTL